MSEDPIGFKSGDLNQYRYVFNQPLILSDPSGEIAPLIFWSTGITAGTILGMTLENPGSFAGGLLTGGFGCGAVFLGGKAGLVALAATTVGVAPVLVAGGLIVGGAILVGAGVYDVFQSF